MFDTYWGEVEGHHAVSSDPSPNQSSSSAPDVANPNPSSSSAPDEPSSGASEAVGASGGSTDLGTIGNPPVCGDDAEMPPFSAYDVVDLDGDALDGDALEGDEFDVGETDLDGEVMDDLPATATDPHGHPAPGTSDHALGALAVMQPSEREQKKKELEAKIAELRQGHGFNLAPNGLPTI